MGTQTAEATVPVLDAPQILPALNWLLTENLTLDSKGRAQGAIDSRAATTGEIPDPSSTSGRSRARSRRGGRRWSCSRRRCSA